MVLSLTELNDFLSKESIYRYIFSIENQEYQSDSVTYKLIFDCMSTISHQRAVLLSNKDSVICFENVTEIYIPEKRSVLGWIIYIKCSDSQIPAGKTYTVIAA